MGSDVIVAGLGWQAWLTVLVLVGMVVSLVRGLARTDYVLMGALGLLLLAGVVTPQEAFAGFSNVAVLTVASLFVVAEAVHRTNALKFLEGIFSRSSNPGRSLPSLMGATAGLSAFLNNTPVVAMLTPRVQQWAADIGIAPSKVLIPLSYAAIAGGLITLVGTSTTIVVSGLLEAEGMAPLQMFDLTWIGLPAAIAVIVFFAVGGHRLLPNRPSEVGQEDSSQREYQFELKVPEGSRIAGKTVEEAGLRALGEAFLVRIWRGENVRSARPSTIIGEGDVLSFSGSARAVDRLLQAGGLEPVVRSVVESDTEKLPLFEAVVAPASRLVGRTLKEARFRESYGGVVLAVRRRDEQLRSALGSQPIRAGDLLLVEADGSFGRRWSGVSEDFYIVSRLRGKTPVPNARRAPLAVAILFGMVITAAMGWIPLVTAAFCAALAMVLFRCLRGREAQHAVDVKVLVVIAAALGIGRAVENTGLSDVVSNTLVHSLAPFGTVAVMIGLYVCTNVLTELITHKAAAVLMIPVALAAAATAGVEPKAFALVVAVGAAASFMTPIGYQTNLMVMSAGGYRFSDYFRVGLPVSIMVMAIAVTMIHQVWIG